MRLETLGEVAIEWGVFSLAIANRGDEGRADAESGSALALRVALAVREAHGNPAMGRFFMALGGRIHQHGEEADSMTTITGAIRDAGIDGDIATRAVADPATWDAVVAQHDALVARHKAFGVPTILLDAGDGSAIFGPVISEVPGDEEAIELWRHVSWLVRNENFSELKRNRGALPSLRSVELALERKAREKSRAS